MSSNNTITDNRVTLNGVKVYPFRSFDELLAFAETHKGILVSINAEKILHATDETRGIINRNIGYCDGVGAVYAMRQKGHPEACKLPGCELWLKTIAARYRNKTFYLVGGRQEVIDETVAKLRKEYPGIRIVGFRNRDLVILEEEFRAVSDVFKMMTDDGSYGEKGLVTNALRALIEAGNAYDEVIAIGPVPMMKFVSLLTKEFGIKTTVSMNPIMIDGTGMCGCCRLTVAGKTKFACVDGPDFDGHEVDYDEIMKRASTYKEFERRERELACNLFKKEVR